MGSGKQCSCFSSVTPNCTSTSATTQERSSDLCSTSPIVSSAESNQLCNQSVLWGSFFFFSPSLPCFFPGAIFSPLLVFSTFIPLNSVSGGILSVVILSGLNFRLVSKELFYLCFNKALGESNSEDRVLAAASSPAKHSQPLLPQDKSSYHLHATPHPNQQPF